MTASLPNVSSFPALASAAQPGAAAAGVQDPAAAFEAMMAAFLGEITATDPAAAQAAVPPGVAASATVGKTADAGEAVEVAVGEDLPDATVVDMNALVLVALAEATPAVAPQAAPPQAATAQAAATEAAAHVPHAFGQHKAASQPAAPALENADPNAAFLQDDAAPADGALPKPAAEAGRPLKPEHAGKRAQGGFQTPQAAATASAPTQNQPVAEADLPAAPAPAAQPAAAQSAEASGQAAVAAAPEAAQAAQPAAKEKVEAKVERKAGARVEAFAEPNGAAAPAASGRSAPVHAQADAARAGPQAPQDAPLPETAAAPAEAQPAEFQTSETQGPTERAATQAVAGAASHTAQVRGSPETVANLSAQILRKLDARSTRFDVQLDPLGLGMVDVRVEIGAHGKMTAALSFENPQAAQELKSRAGELQKALELAGFDLSGGMSFDVAGDQGRPSPGFMGDGGREAGSAFRGRAFRAALDTAGEADLAASRPLTLRRGVNAGLDVRI